MGRWLVSFAFLVFAGAPVSAADPVADTYLDEDVAAIAYKAPPGRRGEVRAALNKRIQAQPHPVLLSHRAYLFLRAGDEANARRDFEHALTLAEHGSPSHRQVLWAYGWGLYDMGDVTSALASWQLCERLHGGRPGWVPYTYSLAYWTLGDAETALAWYTTAVRSNPAWGTRSGLAERTDHWQPEQQRQIQGLFAAWSTRAEAAPVQPSAGTAAADDAPPSR